MTGSEIDRRFDAGESVLEFFDLSRAERPNRERRSIEVDVPSWVVDGVDRVARRRGVSRQVLLEEWIAEKLAAASPR